MLDATSNHFQITKLPQYHSILTAWSHRPEGPSELISQKGLCYMSTVHPVETFSSSFTGTTPCVQRRSFARERREKSIAT